MCSVKVQIINILGFSGHLSSVYSFLTTLKHKKKFSSVVLC